MKTFYRTLKRDIMHDGQVLHRRGDTVLTSSSRSGLVWIFSCLWLKVPTDAFKKGKKRFT